MYKKDFPFFAVHPVLVYADSAATTQKPQIVIDALTKFYTQDNAPIHRGIYQLAEHATTQYEAVRVQVAQFLHARDAREIIFTSGATEGINIIATAWAMQNLKQGDEIVLTELEHHANILPWQRVAQQLGVKLRFIPVTAEGELDLSNLSQIITARTKLIAMTLDSNICGPIDATILSTLHAAARSVGAKILYDAAQAVVHQFVDVQKLDCDFLAFSGHKLYGPTGVGVLYIRKELHDQIEPYRLGGGMVFDADFECASWRQLPQRLEAGTPPVAQVMGLGAALQYLMQSNRTEIFTKEAQLTQQLSAFLQTQQSITLLKKNNTQHLVTFTVKEMHAHDVAALFDQHHICVRAGNHCCQPFHRKLGVLSTVRVSFGMYSDEQDVHNIIKVLQMIS